MKNKSHQITLDNISFAHKLIHEMDAKSIEHESEEIFESQPVLLFSVLKLKEYGISYEHIEVLLYILLVLMHALKISGYSMPKISDEELVSMMTKVAAYVAFSEGTTEKHVSDSIDQFMEHHVNKNIFAYIIGRLKDCGILSVQQEEIKYLVLTAYAFAVCFSNVS